MSCRIVRDPAAVRPLAWRPGPGGEDRQDAAAEPDPAAQELKLAQQRLSQLQQSMEQRLRESFEAGRREGEQLAHKQAAAQIEGLQAPGLSPNWRRPAAGYSARPNKTCSSFPWKSPAALCTANCAPIRRLWTR